MRNGKSPLHPARTWRRQLGRASWSGLLLRVPRNVLFHLNRLCHLNGLCCLGGLGDDSGCPTEAVEVRGYSLGVLSNGLYVVEADHTIFHRLANLRGGTIELQLNLQLLEPIYLREQPRPYFFNGAVENAQLGGLLLKIRSCESPDRDAPPRGSQGRERRPLVCAM